MGEAIDYFAAETRAREQAERAAAAERKCLRVEVGGCTNPKRPSQDVLIRYQGPDGKPIYHTVHTDANGCYQDYNVATEGGPWTATAELAGNICYAPVTVGGSISVPLPPVGHPEGNLPDPARQMCAASVSSNVEGTVENAVRESAIPGAKTEADEMTVKLTLAANASAVKDTLRLTGGIELSNLREVSVVAGGRGLLHGRFRWVGEQLEAIGTVTGTTGIGTHAAQVCTHCQEAPDVAKHWEFSLDGVIVKGTAPGARLRMVLALDLDAAKLDAAARPLRLAGAIEGTLEKGCDLSSVARELRVSRAIAEYAQPPLGACRPAPDLARISKLGRGKIILDRTRRDRCSEGACGSSKSWSRLAVPFKSDVTREGREPVLADGVLSVPQLITVLDPVTLRGEHGGDFLYIDRRGVRVRGEMLGISNAGTHRKPVAQDYEAFDAAGHLEGKLVGTILDGSHQGARVEARYAIAIPVSAQRTHPVVMTLEGWVITGCLEAPQARAPAVPNPPVSVPVTPPTAITAETIKTAFDKIYRPFESLPRDAVAAYAAAEGGSLSEDAKLRLRAADLQFRQLDKNSHGYLTQDEFAVMGRPAVLHSKGPSSPSPLAQKYLQRYDRNKDGVITRSEAGEAWGRLQLLDANRDGRLTVDELDRASQVLYPQKFGKIDRNGDGKIDFTEFAIWWHTLPAATLQIR